MHQNQNRVTLVVENGGEPVHFRRKFFGVTSKRDGKFVAKCNTCVNKCISGITEATSNFVRHVKVTLISLD